MNADRFSFRSPSTRALVAAIVLSGLSVPATHAGVLVESSVARDAVHRQLAEEYTGVGYLTNQDDFFGSAFCSAALLQLNENWALTAAHCVDFVTTLQVGFGPDDTGSDVFNAVSWYVPDSWTGNLLGGNDIALVRLDPGTTPGSSKERYALSTKTANELVGASPEKRTIVSVGYGNTGNGAVGQISGTAGTKRAGENLIDGLPFNDSTYEFDFDVNPGDSALQDYFEAPLLSRDDPENDFRIALEIGLGQGDSGGPDFIGNDIVGVHSYGWGRNDLATNFGFSDLSGSAFVPFWSSWIEAVIFQVESGLTPTGNGLAGVSFALSGGTAIADAQTNPDIDATTPSGIDPIQISQQRNAYYADLLVRYSDPSESISLLEAMQLLDYAGYTDASISGADALSALGASDLVGGGDDVVQAYELAMEQLAEIVGDNPQFHQTAVGSNLEEYSFGFFLGIGASGESPFAGSLLGDFDLDGVLDLDDVELLHDAIGSESLVYDLPGAADNSVDVEDLEVWLEDLFGSKLGDLDLDGDVDIVDFGEFALNFGADVDTYALGDLDGDGDVDIVDFGLFGSNFGFGTALSEEDLAAFSAFAIFAESTVPEPTSLALLSLGGLAVLRRRREA